MGSLPVLVVVGAFGAGCGGGTQAGSTSQAHLTAAARNKAACQYVLVTWSPLGQGFPKGYEASDFDRVVASASSPDLRHELALMQRLRASRDPLAPIPQLGAEMVQTCDRLGLSEVDRLMPTG